MHWLRALVCKNDLYSRVRSCSKHEMFYLSDERCPACVAYECGKDEGKRLREGELQRATEAAYAKCKQDIAAWAKVEIEGGCGKFGRAFLLENVVRVLETGEFVPQKEEKGSL